MCTNSSIILLPFVVRYSINVCKDIIKIYCNLTFLIFKQMKNQRLFFNVARFCWILHQDIGKQHLDFLLTEERYEDAARLCVKILGRNREMWEEEVFKFAQIHQLKVG